MTDPEVQNEEELGVSIRSECFDEDFEELEDGIHLLFALISDGAKGFDRFEQD